MAPPAPPPQAPALHAPSPQAPAPQAPPPQAPAPPMTNPPPATCTPEEPFTHTRETKAPAVAANDGSRMMQQRAGQEAEGRGMDNTEEPPTLPALPVEGDEILSPPSSAEGVAGNSPSR
uniref:Uncharacterized protein n=1 Tax=Lotharella oceanica TaxID=641309 RepID=A0A7S2TR70_9EUKA